MLLDTLLRPNFNTIIRSRMIEKRMTPDQLAKKSKISRATIYNMLRGLQVTDGTLFAVAKALDLNVRDLLTEQPLGDVHQKRKAR